MEPLNRDVNGNVVFEVDEGVSVTGDPIFKYKGYSVFVGIVHTSGDQKDLPHYLIFNDEHGVLEGATSKIVEARAYATSIADANEEQETKLAAGLSLSDKEEKNSGKRNGSKDWN